LRLLKTGPINPSSKPDLVSLSSSGGMELVESECGAVALG
jgi:hypothetical protein